MNASGVRGLAVDVPAQYQHPLLLGFETDDFFDATLGRTKNDISLKRNLGLLVGRMAGWSNLLFLDDDITDIVGMNGMISRLAHELATGFLVSKFPDNSVVRHAERLSGIEPGVKLGGGALLVDVAHTSAFFPRIYNEDWFFLCGMGSSAAGPAVGAASQKPYDPFVTPSRARSEEFGDLLAEGILRLTKNGFDHLRTSVSDWRQLLAERKLLIENIRTRLEDQGSIEQAYMATRSLIAAEVRLHGLTPQTCVAYIAAWQRDLDTFRERLALLPRQKASVAQIVESAGLRRSRPMLVTNK